MSNNAYARKSEAQTQETLNGPSADNHTNQTAVVHAAPEPPRFVAPTHSGADIYKLLTELEDIVEKPRKFMGAMRLDEDRFHMTVMKIRANLPEEMKRASKLARDSERIVEEAREHADRVVEDARQGALTEFERGKSEATHLLEQAQKEAARVQEAARAEAVRLKREAQTESARFHETAEREAEQLREQASKAGEEAIAEAKAQAVQLVADSEIVRQAQATAQDVQIRAEQEATAVRRGADDYARDVLANLENVLGKAITQIQRGREMLDRV